MKVLLINLTDGGSGSGIAANALVNELNNAGIEAKLGVLTKQTVNPNVFILPQKKKKILKRIINKIKNNAKKISEKVSKIIPNPFKFRTSNEIFHSTNFHSDTDINWINNSDYDVINLHWINGVICNKDIAKITKPIVWTMHDSWPCCGAEHHPNIHENDTRWKNGYFRNNKPRTTKGFDLCRKVWKQKYKYLRNKNIYFTAPTKWEADILKSSYLFKNNKCFTIPNIINHQIFKPKDKEKLKKLFNIPDNKIILGFGAAYDIDNPNSLKGGNQLIQLLQKLDKNKYFLVIFGTVSTNFISKLAIDYFSSGFISNQTILSNLYNMCDIFINPSHVESMSYTSLEAASCGVPTIAFNVSGITSIVLHKQTGWLATPYNVDELYEGIDWCLNNYEYLSENCLKKSEIDFNEQKTTQKMINVYSSVLKD